MTDERGFVDPISILFFVLLTMFVAGVAYKAVTEPSVFSLEDIPPVSPQPAN